MKDEDVICHDCGADVGEPCVYLPVFKGKTPTVMQYRPAKLLARIALTGTPMKRPHLLRTRWRKHVEAAKHKRHAKHEDKMLIRSRAATPAQRRIAASEREFDYRQWLQLRAWLAAHADIFKEPHDREA